MNQASNARGAALKKVFRRGNVVTCCQPDRAGSERFRGEVAMLSFNSVTVGSVQLANEDLPRLDGKLTLEIVTPDGFYASSGTYAGSSRPGEIRIAIVDPPSRIERRGLLRVDCQLPLTWRLLGGAEAAPLITDAAAACREILPGLRIDAYPELLTLLQAMVSRIEALEGEIEVLRKDAEKAAAAVPDVIENLSGDGLLFRTCRKVQPGDKVEAAFRLDDTKADPFLVEAVVRRVVDSRDRQGRIGVGCELVGLNLATRDHIVNWVMEVHRQVVRGRPEVQ